MLSFDQLTASYFAYRSVLLLNSNRNEERSTAFLLQLNNQLRVRIKHYIVTCAHSMRDIDDQNKNNVVNYSFIYFNGQSHHRFGLSPADIVTVWKNCDLIALEIRESKVIELKSIEHKPPIFLVPNLNSRIKDPIYMWQYPIHESNASSTEPAIDAPEKPKYAEGSIKRISGVNHSQLIVEIASDKGSSGSPYLDRNGNVIGVHCKELQEEQNHNEDNSHQTTKIGWNISVLVDIVQGNPLEGKFFNLNYHFRIILKIRGIIKFNLLLMKYLFQF